MIYALKVRVDFDGGKRAGGINPRDRNLPTHPSWQNIHEGWEVRLVKAGDVERFRGVDGVQVLQGFTAIDTALDGCRRESYTIEHEGLCAESVRQKGLNLADLPHGCCGETLARELHRRGAIGIRRAVRQPVSALHMAKRHGLVAEH